MPNRSKTDIVERLKLLEEEVYPSGTNTPDTATAGEDGKLKSVNTDEIDAGKLIAALDAQGYDITGVGNFESDSVNTGEAQHKSEGRDVWNSDGQLTVNVPTDFSTIQEAVDALAFLQVEKLKINVDDGDYTGEDVHIPPFLGQFIDRDTTDGAFSLAIEGNTTTPSNVSVGSFVFDNCRDVKVSGFGINNVEPYTAGGAGVEARWSQGVLVENLVFEAGSWGSQSIGIRAYTSQLSVKDTDFGTDLLLHGVIAKRGGTVIVQVNNTDVQGNVTGTAYLGTGGGSYISFDGSATLTGTNNQTSGDGVIFDTDSGRLKQPDEAELAENYADPVGFNDARLDGLRRLAIASGRSKLSVSDENLNTIFSMYDDQSVATSPIDLSGVVASDGRLYNHNGGSSISADGGTTSSKGYYVWSSADSEFKSVVKY